MKCSSIISFAALSVVLLTISVQNSCLAAQTKPGPTSTLNDQKTELTLKLPNAPPVVLDTAEEETLITTLAGARAGMKPPRPVADPAPGSAVNVATVGRWWTQPDGTGIDLAVSHPGYGWVGFVLGSDRDRATEPALVSLHLHQRPVRAKHVSERK
jgi:hypothetical protein